MPPLDRRTKTELCSLYVHTSGGRYVEGVCGRSGGAGVDCAVCRDDRGLGAVASPTLTGRSTLRDGRVAASFRMRFLDPSWRGAWQRHDGSRTMRLVGRSLGKSRMDGGNCAVHVDTSS